MKNGLILLFTLLISATIFGQKNDTLPPYKQFPTVPPFRILLMDSTTWFSKSNLSAKKPTLVLYFSPDCGHCQLETEEMISNMKELQKLQIVMVASRPFADVKNFSNHYKINRFPNIKYGVDPARFIVNFYNVEFTPFSALYNKKGQLVKVFKDGIKWDELYASIK